MGHHRLFVAIRPPRHVRDALLALSGEIPGARWQDDAQLHLTLRFIGEVDHHRAEDVAAALGAVAHPRFELMITGVGRFEGRERGGGVIWAGLAPAPELGALHRKVGRALLAAGVPPETRAYLPHVTLARLPRGAGPVEPFLARNLGLAGPAFTVEDFTLFESTLAPEGAVYAPVARYTLRALRPA